MTVARLAGRLAGVPRSPKCPFLPGGTGSGWSGGVRDGLDAVPCGGDRLGPGPTDGDFQGSAAPAVHEAGSGVQDAVAQRLRLGPGEVAVQGQQLQPGQQDARGHGRVQPGLVQPVVMRWEMAEPGVLAGADHVLHPGMDAVGCVDVGALAQPAPRVRGPVRYPQAVAPAVFGLEQGQLRAGVRPLPAREDPHRLRPGAELVAAGAFAQQPGQLGDVRFFYPALAVRAARIGAGVTGAALADLALAVDRGLPCRPGDLADRGPLPRAQLPADGVGELVAVPSGEPVQFPDQGMAGPGTVAGDHQLAP